MTFIKNLLTLKHFQVLFLNLWILSILWLISLLALASNIFKVTVDKTSFGASSLFLNSSLFIILLGILAFTLLILCTFVQMIIYRKSLKHNVFSINIKNLFKGTIVTFAVYVTILGIFLQSNPIIGKKSFSTNLEIIPLADTLPFQPQITIEELLKRTNKERVKEGIVELKLNEKLNHAAELKLQDMLSSDYWAHYSPEGTGPWTFIQNSGYKYIYAGENLARGFNTSDEVVSAWVASPGHRENLYSGNYTEVGFAIKKSKLTGEDTILVVQMFASPSIPTTDNSRISNLTESNTSLNADDVRNYRDKTISVRESWEKAKDKYSESDMDMLLDSFNRQIAFCNTIIENINNNRNSNDSIGLWNAVINMGNETRDLTARLNSQ